MISEYHHSPPRFFKLLHQCCPISFIKSGKTSSLVLSIQLQQCRWLGLIKLANLGPSSFPCPQISETYATWSPFLFYPYIREHILMGKVVPCEVSHLSVLFMNVRALEVRVNARRSPVAVRKKRNSLSRGSRLSQRYNEG